MFAVVVSLTLKPGRAAVFLPPMRSNARPSLQPEAGCRQFDVARDLARQDDDSAAFDAHLATVHFRQFDEQTPQMVAHKDVRTFSQVSQ
ncbi:MAG: antibiotic biosynthesis monooxygenase [Roseobacter sp.]|nr:antibiotic biosynthesis monooxygenase [Roseobacter sp.]